MDNGKKVSSKTEERRPCMIAIASMGNNMESEVARSFSSAPFFIMSSRDQKNYSVIENTARNLGSEAGVGAARILIDAGTNVLVTGNIGPRASDTLEKAGITVHAGCSGKVSEAFDKCLSGKLIETKGASYSGCLESPGTAKIHQ